MRADDKTFVDELRSLARIEDAAVVREHLENVRAEDVAQALVRLEVEESLSLLRLMDEELAAYVLIELPTETARAYLDELSDAAVAHYLDILPMDDAAELREELSEERFNALLNVIPQEDAQEIRRLLSHPEDSAGQLMTEDFVSVRPADTMQQVLALIRATSEEDYEMVNYIYVLDPFRRLVGLLSLKRVIRSEPDNRAEEVMRTEVMSILVTTPQEEAARQMARYGLVAMPVVDEVGRMVGIITADDAQEVLEEAATEDVLKLGGVIGDAEAYLSLSPWELVKRRLPWLMILFVAEIFTGAVLRHYTRQSESSGTTTLAQLMLFVPLLIGAGGNTGSQVTTTITRALAVGEVSPHDAFTVLRREFVVALAIGATLGTVGFLRAYYGWGSGWTLSLIVGIALPAIILWATTVGSLLPLGAKRFGVDPAVMSAPFITTFVDATGLVIYFEIARRLVQV